MSRETSTIIIIGAAWGFVEATLGCLLHTIHAPFKGAIMLPFVIGFIMTAYSSTGKVSASAYVALIAAMIKLTDLFIPFSISYMGVINPAIYILIEGLIGAVILKATNMKRAPKLRLSLSPRLTVPALVIAIATTMLI